MRYFATIADPRDPTAEHMLDVSYEARRGAKPSFCPIYGGDPGYDPEYDLDEVTNKRGNCILRQLNADQLAAVEHAVHDIHQF